MHNEQEINQEELQFKADATSIQDELKNIVDEITNQENTVNPSENVSEEDNIKAELATVQDKYLRLYSEFDNYKRRTTKERSDLFKTANQETVLAMLPILDDFERAMDAMPDG